MQSSKHTKHTHMNTVKEVAVHVTYSLYATLLFVGIPAAGLYVGSVIATMFGV